MIGGRLVAILMKRQNLTAIRLKRFVPQTTDSLHNFGYSRNLLKNAVKHTFRKSRDVGRRHYLSAAVKQKVLLSGDVSGQVHAPCRRVAGVAHDDGAIGN